MAIKTEVLSECKRKGIRLVDGHPNQAMIYDADVPVKVINAGRNFGKSILMIMECLKYMATHKESVGYFVFPTLNMAKQIVWPDLCKIIQFSGWKHKINNHGLSIDLPNSNKIYMASADKSDRLRGLRINFLGVDEYASMRDQTLWEEILEPTLTHDSRCIITSTPKGYNEFYKLWLKGQNKNQKRYKSWSFKTTDNPTCPEYNKRTEQEKAYKDKRLYRQENEASFEVSAGKVSPDFDRKIHVIENMQIFDKQIRVSCDFNVNPMAWIIFQIIPKELIELNYAEHLKNKNDLLRPIKLQSEIMWIIHELRTEECNTSLQCNILGEYLNSINYPDVITFYGDSTGSGRDTTGVMNSSGKIANDWDIIRMYFPNMYTKFESNTVQRNRINALNMKIKNANNEIGLFLSNTCKYSIQDLEQVSWDEKGRNIDKTIERSKGGHCYDSISYAAQQEFDLKYSQKGAMYLDINFSKISNNLNYIL